MKLTDYDLKYGKLLEYIKLFSAIRYKTVYIFVLNDWFKRPEYRDILSKKVSADYEIDIQLLEV